MITTVTNDSNGCGIVPCRPRRHQDTHSDIAPEDVVGAGLVLVFLSKDLSNSDNTDNTTD